jgi:hypothetical protein
MEFPTPIVTELTAPNTVPFQPGQNVIGIGSQIPPELVAAGVTAAIIFYNNTWNTSLTVPTTKFQFIASIGGSIVSGVGYSNNPSTTPTATVAFLNVLGEYAPGAVARAFWSLQSSYPTAVSTNCQKMPPVTDNNMCTGPTAPSTGKSAR